MDKVIKHGIQLAAGLTPASQKEMRATLAQIFSEAGSQIDFNTPENKKGIQALAHLMRDMFSSVGKGDMFDFSKMIESPEKMFKEMGSAAKEFEGVWNDIVTRMGNNSLSSIFMKNQSELSVALERMENASSTAQKRIVANMQKAFEPVKSGKVNSLLEEAEGLKGDFTRGKNWETRTTAALRYLNVYQRIMTLTKDGLEIDGLGPGMDKILADIKNIGPYTIEQIESVKPQLQASLQNLFNLASGKPLIGLTDGGVIDVNVAPKVIKTLDVGDVLGGRKTSINIPVVPEVDPEFEDKLQKLFKAYKNKDVMASGEIEDQLLEGLSGETYDKALDRLSAIGELKSLTNRSVKAVWKDFVGFGLPVGSGGDGTGGFGEGTGDGPGTGDASSAEIEDLRRQLEDANRKREEAELAERIAQDNAIAERHFTDEAEEKADMYRRAMDSMQEEMDDLRGRLVDAEAGAGGGGAVGDNSLKQLEKDAEAASKAFEEATNRLHEIYEEERRLNEQIANAGLIDYDEKIQAAGAARENALNALKQKLPKKADHKGNVEEMQSIVKNMIDKGALSGISKPTDLYFVEQYMNAVADYSKHTNAELNHLLEKAVSTIDRKTKETISDYKDAQRRQEEDDPNGLIAKRRKLAEEHAAASKAYNDTADAKREAYDKLEAAKQHGGSGSSGEGRTAEDVENARKIAEYEAQARAEAEAIERANTRRVELAEQLELYADDGTYFSLDELEGQKVALQEVLNTLKQESLLTDELQARYDTINQSIQDRITYQKEYANAEQAAEKSFDELNGLHDKIYDTDDPDEANAFLEERKRILSEISPLVREDYAETIEAEMQTNSLIEKRIALLRDAHAGKISFDDIDNIMDETGDLESKLERLQEVSGDWGSKVKDSELDEDDDALESLQQFEETYDRIVLKLANGRNIEILPNAKGLRALHKYYDGMDSGSYGESEITDIEFVRKEMQQIDHAAQQAKESVAGLNNELTTTGDKAGKVDTSLGGTDPLGNKVDTTTSQTDGATTEEVENLKHVQEAVAKITAEVKEKTQEFLNEQTAVKKVAESEVHALGEVEKKVTAIRVALSNVNTLLNNIKKGKDVGDGLSNITINVNHKEDGGTKQTKEAWALEDTLRNKTNGLLGKIVTNTDAIKANTKDVAKDATLKQVLTALKTKTKATPATPAQPPANQPAAKPTVTNAGGNLLKMYERLGALGVQKNALDPNSEERKGIEEKIRLLKEEINKKLKLVSVDKQLIAEAQKKGAADQRAQMMTVGGRKSDTKAAKDEKVAVNDLLKAYERLGALRVERDMLPKGARRDELQKEIKSETSRLWKRSKRLGVDSAQTGEATDRGAHIVQMDQLIEKTKLLGQYERDIILMKKGSEAYNNAQNRINELNSEIALIKKKITLTQEEKLELDALINKNDEAAQKKSSAQKDKEAAAARKSEAESIKNILTLYEKLGAARAHVDSFSEDGYEKSVWEDEVKRLRSEIATLKKKTPNLTVGAPVDAERKGYDTEKFKIDKARGKQLDSAEIKERNAVITDILAKTKELGTWQAKLAVADKNSADAKNAQERTRSLSAEIKGLKDKVTLTQDEYETLQEVLKTNREIVQTKLSGKQTKDEKKRIADEKKLAKKRAMTGKAGSTIGRAESVWLDAEEIKNVAPDEVKNQIKKLYKELDVLRIKQNDVNNATEISDEQSTELIEQTKHVNKLTEALGPLISEYHKLSGTSVNEINSRHSTLTDKSGLEDYKTTLQQYVQEITKGKGQITGFNAETRTLTYTVKTGKNEFTEYTAAVRHLDNQLVSVQGTTKRTETFLEATKRKMKEISSYMSGMQTISKGMQWLRQGIQYVREIDLALTELKKVTDETEESYDQFLQTAAKTGARLGTTISAVTEATSTFAKLGYTIEQATEMAEAAIVYKNVGDNIASTEDAADSIISTLKGFGMEASEAMAIVDRFNEVGE